MVLLSDPWFDGTCFDGGWGLRFRYSDALSRARMATHVWISHPHSDHLHVPTLRQVARAMPHVPFLAARPRPLTASDVTEGLPNGLALAPGDRVISPQKATRPLRN